jgi:hypothetical protein
MMLVLELLLKVSKPNLSNQERLIKTPFNLGAQTFSMTTFSIVTLSIVTLSING